MEWEEERSEVKLKYPVKWGEEKVQSLSLRPLMAKDLMDFKINTTGEMSFGQLLEIAGRLCDHEGGMSLIKVLHGTDAMAVASKVGDFLGESQETGN